MSDQPLHEPALHDDDPGRNRGTVIAATIVGVLVVIGIAWVGASWLLDDGPEEVAIDPLPSVTTPSPDPVPSPSPTPTTTPTSSPTPSPEVEPSPTPTETVTVTADPSPAPSPTPESTTPAATDSASDSSSDDPAIRPGDLVAATSDGVVVHHDGRSRRLPGLTGPVDRAWHDGEDGIVFARNNQGVGRLADGDITTVVALSSFRPREVDDVDAEQAVTIRPRELYLVDVDATAGRLAVAVRFTADDDTSGSTPNDRLTFYESDLDGGSRRQVIDSLDFEGSAHVALGGPRWLLNTSSESGGSLTVVPRGEVGDPLVELEYSFVTDEGTFWQRGQLDDAGTRLAATARVDGTWRLLLHDVDDDTARSTMDVPRPHPSAPVVADLVGQRVVLVGTGEGDAGDSAVLDLETGSSRTVQGWVTIAR